jgi:hypothetical protein
MLLPAPLRSKLRRFPRVFAVAACGDAAMELCRFLHLFALGAQFSALSALYFIPNPLVYNAINCAVFRPQAPITVHVLDIPSVIFRILIPLHFVGHPLEIPQYVVWQKCNIISLAVPSALPTRK